MEFLSGASKRNRKQVHWQCAPEIWNNSMYIRSYVAILRVSNLPLLQEWYVKEWLKFPRIGQSVESNFRDITGSARWLHQDLVWEDDDGILLRTWLPKRQSREPYPSYIAGRSKRALAVRPQAGRGRREFAQCGRRYITWSGHMTKNRFRRNFLDDEEEFEDGIRIGRMGRISALNWEFVRDWLVGWLRRKLGEWCTHFEKNPSLL